MPRISSLCASINVVLAASATPSTRGGSVPRRRAALLAFALIVAVASQTHAALQSAVKVLTDARDGTWKYSTSNAPGPGNSTPADFPTTIPATAFQSYVLPDYNPDLGGDHWSGGFADNDSGTYHVFTTYLQADINKVVPITLTGDDGHSLFVDGVFVAGGGFGSSASHQLYLPSGMRRRIDVVGYNAHGPWGFNVGESYTPQGAVDLQPGLPLRHTPSVRMNADGVFPDLASATMVSNLSEPHDLALPISARAPATSFTTDSASYLLDSVTLATAPFNRAGVSITEVRIRADGNGKPGEVLGILSADYSDWTVAKFVSTGITLEPNSTYWMTLNERVGQTFFWPYTSSTDQTNPSPSGWTIGNGMMASDDHGESWEPLPGEPADLAIGLFQVDARRLPNVLTSDFDGDGDVDGADLGLINLNYGRTLGGVTIDGGAVLKWQREVTGPRHVEQPAPPVTAAVPEPNGLALACLAMMALANRRPRLTTWAGHRTSRTSSSRSSKAVERPGVGNW